MGVNTGGTFLMSGLGFSFSFFPIPKRVNWFCVVFAARNISINYKVDYKSLWRVWIDETNEERLKKAFGVENYHKQIMAFYSNHMH